MARRGNPYDNAQAESFTKTLKAEEVHLAHYEDEGHARRRLAYFRDEVYNQRRPHSRLGFHAPSAFEAALLQQAATTTTFPQEAEPPF